MSVDVYIRTGLSISVTPQASPSYIIGTIPVEQTGSAGASQQWVDTYYYPRDNPSGYATGIDGNLFVRKTESGQFAPSGMTGQFITTAQTGLFYPASNPAGYVTASQAGGVLSINITGQSLTGIIAITGIGGTLVDVSGSTIRISGSASIGNTGQFITTAQTGQFAPSGLTGQFVTTDKTGGFVSISQTGQFIDTSKTGQFAPSGMTGQFITSAQTGQFAPSGLTGQFITTAQTGQFAASGMTGQFITSAQTGQYAPAGMTGQFVTTDKTGQYAPAGLTGQFITSAQTGQYAPSGMTGQFVTTAQTGIFYPSSNPAGYITSAQAGGVSAITVTGASISGNVNLTGIGGLNVSLSGQYILISGGSATNTGTLVSKGETGVFVTIFQTGQFAPSGMTGQFVTSDKTGQFVDSSKTGVFVTTSQTGQFAPSGLTGQFITSAQTGHVHSQYLTGPYGVTSLIATGFVWSGSAVTGIAYSGNIVISGGGNVFVFTGATSGLQTIIVSGATGNFVFQSMTGQFVDSSKTGGFVSISQTGQFVDSSKTGGFVSISQTGQFITTAQTGQFAPSGMTGQFITTAQTGIFYPSSNPAGYITSAQAGGVSALTVTGASLSGNVNLTGLRGINISLSGQYILVSGGDTGQFITTAQTGQFAPSGMTGQFVTTDKTGQFAPSGMTGQFITTAQTGIFYPASNPNNYITSAQAGGVSAISVTGASVSGNVNFTGLRGINVSLSGQYVLVSGGDTGQFITTAQTGQYAPAGLTGQFITSAQTGQFAPSGMTGQFVTTDKTGGFVSINQTGQFVTTAQTGQFAPSGLTGQFITTAQTGHTHSQYLTGPYGVTSLMTTGFVWSGSAVTGITYSGSILISGGGNVFVFTGTTSGLQSIIISGNTGNLVFQGMTGQFVDSSKTGGFVSLSQTGQFVDTAQSGLLINAFALKSATGQFVTTDKTGGFVSISQTGQFVDSSKTGGFVSISQTGQFITTAQTGQFAPSGLTGQFITTAQTGNFLTSVTPVGILSLLTTGFIWSGSAVTGIAFSGSILVSGGGNVFVFTGATSGFQSIIISGATGNLVFQGMTGQFVTSAQTGGWVSTSQTGQFAPSGMTGQFITTAQTGQFAPSGMTGQFITTAQTGIFVVRGETGNAFYPRFGNPSNFLTSAALGGVTGVSITGSIPITGLLNVSGIGGTVVIASGQFLLISGTASTGTSNFVDDGTFVHTTGDQFINGVKSFTGQLKASGKFTINSDNIDTAIIASGYIDNYYEVNIINTHTGTNASSDLVVSNSISESGRYIDLGVNSTGYSGGYIGYTGDAYLFSNAGDLYIGNIVPNRVLAIFAGHNLTGQTNYQTGNAELLILSGQVLVRGQAPVLSNQTGSLILSGAGSVSVFTGDTIGLSQIVIISGAASTGTVQGGGGGSTSGIGTTGQYLSGFINITGVSGTVVDISGSTIRVIGVNTTLFVTTSQTGQFVDTSKTGGFVSISQTGQFVDSSKTGIFSLVSKTASFSNPDGIQSGTYSQAVWRCNQEATLTGIYGYRIGGSGAVVNAYKNSTALSHMAANMNLTSTGSWIFSGTITNASYARGDTLLLNILSVTGLPTAITLQADFV